MTHFDIYNFWRVDELHECSMISWESQCCDALKLSLNNLLAIGAVEKRRVCYILVYQY